MRNLTELIDNNPSRTTVLVGDTVQADPDVFRRVMDARPGSVSVALVHAIPGFKAPACTRDDARFVVFRDYGEAARALCERGLINEAQRDRVLAAVSTAQNTRR